MEAWKKINKERMVVNSPYLHIFLEWASKIGMMGQFTYERGDIFGAPDDLYMSHEIYCFLILNPKRSFRYHSVTVWLYTYMIFNVYLPVVNNPYNHKS